MGKSLKALKSTNWTATFLLLFERVVASGLVWGIAMFAAASSEGGPKLNPGMAFVAGLIGMPVMALLFLPLALVANALGRLGIPWTGVVTLPATILVIPGDPLLYILNLAAGIVPMRGFRFINLSFFILVVNDESLVGDDEPPPAPEGLPRCPFAGEIVVTVKDGAGMFGYTWDSQQIPLDIREDWFISKRINGEVIGFVDEDGGLRKGGLSLFSNTANPKATLTGELFARIQGDAIYSLDHEKIAQFRPLSPLFQPSETAGAAGVTKGSATEAEHDVAGKAAPSGAGGKRLGCLVGTLLILLPLGIHAGWTVLKAYQGMGNTRRAEAQPSRTTSSNRPPLMAAHSTKPDKPAETSKASGPAPSPDAAIDKSQPRQDSAAAAPSTAAQTARALVDGDLLNVRNGTGRTHESIGKVPFGSVVEVLEGPAQGEGGVWYRIAAKDLKGWVKGEYLIVEAANSELGLEDASGLSGTWKDAQNPPDELTKHIALRLEGQASGEIRAVLSSATWRFREEMSGYVSDGVIHLRMVGTDGDLSPETAALLPVRMMLRVSDYADSLSGQWYERDEKSHELKLQKGTP